VRQSSAHVQGWTVSCTRAPLQASQAVYVCQEGQAYLKCLTVTGGVSGVMVQSSATVHIQSSRIRSTSGSGLIFEGQRQRAVKDTVVEAAGLHGLLVCGPQSSVEAQTCQFESNVGSGVHACDAAQMRLHSCKSGHHNGAGFAACSKARVDSRTILVQCESLCDRFGMSLQGRRVKKHCKGLQGPAFSRQWCHCGLRSYLRSA
jgi:hypothetical protein